MKAIRPHRLLFVCTANICRSPMAEGLAEGYAADRGWPIEVASGGIMGLIDRLADPHAVKVMGELGLDISSHRSQGVEQELVDWADYILVMELRHQMKLHERFPHVEGRVLMLGSFGGIHEVRDPIGGWRWRFRKSRDEIRRCVEGFMDRLPPPQVVETAPPADLAGDHSPEE